MNEKELTSSFKALSCETRRKIIYLLKSKCLCAGDIAKHFELTGATISHHLKVLAEGNLITSKKVGLVRQRNGEPKQSIQSLKSFYIKMAICELHRKCICG